MSSNNADQPPRDETPVYAALALVLGVPLLLVAVLMGILSGKSNHPGHGEVLGLVALALVVDACLLFACWHGGLLVRIVATLCGLVALLNTCAALRYAALNLL